MECHFARNLSRRSKHHLNSSSSFHHKRPRLCQQEAFNQNRSFSPITKSKHSLNSCLKEFNLSDKDYAELRQALKRIFYYLQSNIESNDEQRLTSPYLKQRLIDDQSLPLYTNEYFIRNGLLNHNDGPEIYDETFSSRNLSYSKPIFCFESLLPLELLSNQKHLLTALTSNFSIDQPKMGLNLFKSHEKISDNETESILIRRKKVQTWERENILQQKMSIEEDDQIEVSEYHRSSFIQTPSINNDDLFPLVKKLAPYIIIRNSVHDVRTTSDKRTYHQRKKNYLLEEFQSVLTEISKK